MDGQIRFEKRMRVDVEVFESGKKELWIKEYRDTCGRGQEAI